MPSQIFWHKYSMVWGLFQAVLVHFESWPALAAAARGCAPARGARRQKNAPPMGVHFCLLCEVSALGLHLGEALAAINFLIAARFEGNARFFAAGGADSRIHFPRLTGGSAAVFAGGTALLAGLGLVFEATAGVELLLAGGEDEFFAALFAYQRFVLIHD